MNTDSVLDYIPYMKKEAGKLAVKYGYTNVHDYEDVLAMGILGWLEALNRYDTNKSSALFAYASQYAVGYMQRFIRRNNLWRHRNLLLDELPECTCTASTPEEHYVHDEELLAIDIMCSLQSDRDIDIIYKRSLGQEKKETGYTIDVIDGVIERMRSYKLL